MNNEEVLKYNLDLEKPLGSYNFRDVPDIADVGHVNDIGIWILAIIDDEVALGWLFEARSQLVLLKMKHQVVSDAH